MISDDYFKRSIKKYQKPTVLYLCDLVHGSGACVAGNGFSTCFTGLFVDSECFEGGYVMTPNCEIGSSYASLS